MEKSRDAFRTISEVAEWLDVPTHVLRFWESRFAQIKPVKRAGGRRYYRPSDMRVIGGVKSLLHDQGMTIRGVQKLFREKGIKHVSSFSPDLFEDTAGDIVEATASDVTVEGPEELPFIPARPAPSAAATGTRSATPAPVQNDLAANAPHTSDEAEPAEIIEEAAAEAADDALAEQTIFASRRNEDADTAPDTPQAPRIPATPNVPDTDPDDEDVAHASAPSPAARLALARARDLRPHREALSAARDRLSALRERFE